MVNDISKQTISLVQPSEIKTDVVDKPIDLSIDVKQLQEEVMEDKKANFDDLVTQTTKQLNIKMQSIERDLQFNVDEISGDTIITVLDTKTSEVIRQIPSEEVLAIRENIESLKGILFSAEV